MDVGRALVLIAVLVPSVIVHEVAHGVVALRFGDDTAKRAGRLTLNPLPHVDVFGTLLLPAMLAVSGVGVLGYAKPVPVDRRRLRRPRDHGLLVSLAGPATNVVLAVGAAFALRPLLPTDGPIDLGAISIASMLAAFGLVNVVLAAFNLLPVPPLDGSAVIERLLPARLVPGWLTLRRFSMPALLVLVLLFPEVLAGLFDRALGIWVGLL